MTDRFGPLPKITDDMEAVLAQTAPLFHAARHASDGADPIGQLVPPGFMGLFGGSNVPTGWLLCDGTAVSRTDYAALYAAIGTTWGVGDGSTTFNLPDWRGRYPRGVAASGTGSTLGAAFGLDTLPDHVHSIDPPSTASSSDAHSHTHTHTHSVDPPSTNTGGASATAIAVEDAGTTFLYATAHTHAVNIGAFTSGGASTSTTSSDSHSHTTNIAPFNSANPSTDPSILPASRAVHYIIKT